VNLTVDELDALHGCQSAQDWRRVCDEIKRVRKGQYPPDWWTMMMQGGVADRIMARWGGDTKLRMSTLQPDGTWKEEK